MNIWIRRKSTTNQYLQQNAYTDTCKIDENKNELEIFLSGIVLSINKQLISNWHYEKKTRRNWRKKEIKTSVMFFLDFMMCRKNEEEMKKYSVIRKANSLKCLDEEVFKKK